MLGKLSRSAVLIPISVRQERNKKGMFVQKSFFTLIKSPENGNFKKIFRIMIFFVSN
jgi:hypothetical protein